MGIFSSLFGSKPADEVVSALESFTSKAGLPETKFRDLLVRHLASKLSVSPKREAGLLGQGTRIDAFFEHGGEQFLITLKQGLSEQKVKILLGEAVVIASSLTLSHHKGRANIVVVVIDDHRWKEEARDGDTITLLQSLVLLSTWIEKFKRADIRLQLVVCSPEGGRGIHLSD